MTPRLLTQEIFESDCVGDSPSKHNFNLLSLDTEVCNVSSQYFLSNDNFFTKFNELNSNLQYFNDTVKYFYNVDRYNLGYTTVNLLSSFWNKNKFTVLYPINISILNDLSINCPTVNQPDLKLQTLAKKYLNANYPANSFNTGNEITVCMFLYNVPVNPSDPNDLITYTLSPEISYSVRNMYVKFLKQDISFGNGVNFTFKNINDGWTLLNIEKGFTDETYQPTYIASQGNRISTQTGNADGRSKLTITIERDTQNFDLYSYVYNTGLYYPGFSDIEVTINANIKIGSNSKNIAAFIVSGFTSSDTVKIVNNGFIVGYGGNGGNGQDLGKALTADNNGENGGDAIFLNYPVTIVNNNVIAGGGGGGGGGLADFSDTSYLKLLPTSNLNVENIFGGGGGGGGAGIIGGMGGEGGLGNTQPLDPTKNYVFKSYRGDVGRDGTFTSNNLGGGQGGGKGGSGISSLNSATGGAGGSLGQKGVDSGKLDNKNRQLPPFGGNSGLSINGKTFILSLTTNLNAQYISSYGTVTKYGIILGPGVV